VTRLEPELLRVTGSYTVVTTFCVYVQMAHSRESDALSAPLVEVLSAPGALKITTPPSAAPTPARVIDFVPASMNVLFEARLCAPTFGTAASMTSNDNTIPTLSNTLLMTNSSQTIFL